jgi:hypothetical protein
MSQRVRVSIWLLLSVSLTLPAAAQQKEPVGPFAVDLRVAYGRHKAEPSVATDLGVEPGNLPPRTIGLVGGAHVYPLRSSKISLGVGANAVITRGSRALDITETGSTTTVKSPTVRRHFTTISPEISLNFGHSHGWSYISGGMFGRSSLYLDRADAPGSNAPYRSTINYGGGARWFNTDHLAFSVDFRWYSVAEQAATASLVAQPRTTLLLLSAGVSFR